MSLNVQPLPLVKVLDPRLQLEQKQYAVVQGASVNNYSVFVAPSVSNSGVSAVICNPGDRRKIVNRVAFKQITYRITVSGTNTSGSKLLNPGFYAPRCRPIASTTATEEVNINNDSVSNSSINEWNNAIYGHYNNDYKDRKIKMSPSMNDQFQNYEDGINTNKNVLSHEYGNSGSDTDEPRGAFVQFSTEEQQDGNTTAVVNLTVTEAINVSPFVDLGQHSSFYAGLAGISTLTYSCTFTKLNRILSLVKDQGLPGLIDITDVQTDVLDCRLLFNILTPPETIKVPRSLQYAYHNIDALPTQGQLVVPGMTDPLNPSSITLSLNNVQLQGIPKKMFIFAKRSDNQDTPFSTDTYLPLDVKKRPLTIEFNNQTFLSNATAQDLYHLSVKNGNNQTWSQFIKHTGSVVCLNFGVDIGLPFSESSGTVGNWMIRCEASFVNTSKDDIRPKLYVVMVYDGVYNIIDGSANHNNGVLSKNDVVNAQLSQLTFKDAEEIYNGGNFFSTMGSLFRKAKPYIVEAAKKGNQYLKDTKLISKTLSSYENPYSQAAGGIAALLGYGDGPEDDYYGGNLKIENKKNTFDLSKM